MNIISNKGILFIFDTTIVLIILLFVTLVCVSQISLQINSSKNNVLNFELLEKTITIANSIVTNYSVENSSLGSAIIDIDKKRVKSNELSSLNFSNFKEIELEKFFVRSISFEKQDGKQKNIYFRDKISNKCVVVERFVLIDGEKALIFIEGCENE